MKRTLRIIETAALPWWNASAYYAVELSRCLKDRGHRVLFIGTPGSPPFCRASEYGIEVADHIDLKKKAPWALFATTRKLKKLFEEYRPEVINAHQGEGHFLCALASRTLTARPVIVRTRADIRRPTPHPLERTLYEKHTDAVITSGRFMKEQGYFEGFSLDEAKVRTIYAAVDPGLFVPHRDGSLLRKELGIGAEDQVVGITARLSPVKGHSTFIKAAAIVAARVDNARFLIAGQEKQIRREDLMRQATEAGIGAKTRFISQYPDVRQILEIVDVGVIASLGSEAVSRSALEYMSMGKPIVTTSAGVLPEVVENGVTGFVVPPGDEKAMADAITRFLMEPVTRTRMGSAARSTIVKRFSTDEMAARTESFYLELLEERE